MIPALLITQAIEKAEANVAWMEANYEPIWSWLKQQNQVRAPYISIKNAAFKKTKTIDYISTQFIGLQIRRGLENIKDRPESEY